MAFQITVMQDEDDGGWVVGSPQHPGCYSQGDTLAEALVNWTRARQAWLTATAHR